MKDRLSSKRRGTVAAVATAVLGLSMSLPTLAGADVVNDLLKGLGLGGGGATPAAGTPGSGSGYQPPLHGSNPHGEGTVGVVDLSPSNGAPLTDDPAAGDEDIVIGGTRGSQDANGDYHGRVAVAHVNLLGLVNIPILENSTDEGESVSGPLSPLQEGVLDTLCTGLTLPPGCVSVLTADSATTNTGSTNHFRAAGVDLPGLVQLTVAESNGNISDDGNCQTSHGDSTVASANALGVTADTLQASSESQACNNGSQSQTNDSQVLNIAGFALPLPVAGCANGTPDSEFVSLVPLVSTVCNADDTNGIGEAITQAEDPYGVREALTVFGLDVPLFGVTPIKATTARGESRAEAPGLPGTSGSPPDGDGPGTPGGPGGPDGDPGDGAGGGSAAGDVGSGPDSLAFTGSNLLVLALIGGALILGGLMLAGVAGRHRRTAT